jgi:hypothetical protein
MHGNLADERNLISPEVWRLFGKNL